MGVGGKAYRRGVDVVTAVGHGRAALEVKKRVVDAVSDLGSQQSKPVNAGTICEERNDRLVVGALQISPVALRLQAEDPVVALPAIADLRAGRSAGGIVTTFAAKHGRPARMARSPAAIGADIKAAPVVGGGNRSFGKIGGGCLPNSA